MNEIGWPTLLVIFVGIPLAVWLGIRFLRGPRR